MLHIKADNHTVSLFFLLVIINWVTSLCHVSSIYTLAYVSVGIYETPAGTILYHAHLDIENFTLDRV